MSAGTFPSSELFFHEGGTTKSHIEPSRDCREDGSEPGCVAPLGRSQ